MTNLEYVEKFFPEDIMADGKPEKCPFEYGLSDAFGFESCRYSRGEGCIEHCWEREVSRRKVYEAEKESLLYKDLPDSYGVDSDEEISFDKYDLLAMLEDCRDELCERCGKYKLCPECCSKCRWNA